MTYSYSINGSGSIVRNDDAIIPSDPLNSDYAAYLAWTTAGGIATQPPSPTLADFVAQASIALQQKVDGLAQSWGYDNVVSAASYANSTSARFKAEALALIGWRDAVWAWAESQQAAITAGTAPMPANVAAFVALMPAAPSRPAS